MPRFSLFLFSLPLLFSLWLSCAQAPVSHDGDDEFSWTSRTQVHMGTYIHISVPKPHSALINEGFAIFQNLDQLLSSYKPDSEVSRLNRKKALQVSPPTYEILRESLKMSELTTGAFDVTVGAWTQNAYAFGRPGVKVPSAKELEQLKERVDYKHVILQPNHFVRLKGQAQIDLGGIGKGYAVDQVAKHFKKAGLQQAMIAASGDIRCLHPCRIGVRHPFGPSDQVLLSFQAKQGNAAISTSGVYERKVPGTQLHHLLSPETGQPQDHLVSLTLMAQGSRNAELDALATALSVMNQDQMLQLLASRSEVGALWMAADKTLWMNQRFIDLTEAWRWGDDKDDFKIIMPTAKKKN